MSRGGGGDGVETEACSLIGNSGSDRQPVEMSELLSDVNMWKCTDGLLDSLKYADQGLMIVTFPPAHPRRSTIPAERWKALFLSPPPKKKKKFFFFFFTSKQLLSLSSTL